MHLKLEEVSPATDFEELIECEWISFENPFQSFFRLFCPIIGSTPNARENSIKESVARQLKQHESNPTSYWQKVVDTDTGKIVAAALWKICPTNPYKDADKRVQAYWYPEGGQRDFVTKCLEQFDAPRVRMSQRPQVYLNIIYTLPEYRHHGAGDMIVDWGVKKAAEMNVEMWLDATIYGISLYKKHGFVVVNENNVKPESEGMDSDTEWKKIEQELLPIAIWQMWRPVDGKYIEGSTQKPWED